MRKVRAKQLKRIAKSITASSPEMMRKVYRRLKKTWSANKSK
jgi:ribosomal protein S17E